MLPTVSLIVPARNEEKIIKRCIDSLLNLNYPKGKLEIIVNVNNSTDSTEKICKGYGKKIRTVNLNSTGFKAGALNDAIKIAKGDIIGIFDADCVVEKNCLTEAVKHFSNQEIAGVAGTVKSYNAKTLISKAISLETCFVSFLEYFMSKFGANPHFIGKNMFIRKEVLENIGGFNTETSIEDIDISIRMKRAGYKVIFEPMSVAWQEEATTFNSYLKQRTTWGRGIFRLSKMKRNKKEWLSDLMHSMPYYISVYSIIIATFLLISIILNLHWIITYPLLFLFLFVLSMIFYSRIFYKEPLRDLLLLPVWFLLNNIYSLIILPKSYIDEKMNKVLIWHERYG